jgi:hypothetical protein
LSGRLGPRDSFGDAATVIVTRTGPLPFAVVRLPPVVFSGLDLRDQGNAAQASGGLCGMDLLDGAGVSWLREAW